MMVLIILPTERQRSTMQERGGNYAIKIEIKKKTKQKENTKELILKREPVIRSILYLPYFTTTLGYFQLLDSYTQLLTILSEGQGKQQDLSLCLKVHQPPNTCRDIQPETAEQEGHTFFLSCFSSSPAIKPLTEVVLPKPVNSRHHQTLPNNP